MEPSSGPLRTWAGVRRLPPAALDVAMAASFLVAGLATTTETGHLGVDYQPRDGAAVALVVAATVPYALRRRAPLPVLVVSATAFVLLALGGYSVGVLPFVPFFGAYTVGARRPLPEALVAAAVVLGLVVALYVGGSPGFETQDIALNFALFGSAILVGWNVQSRRLRLDALERSQEEATRRAAADERLHIAQELHDVVAHSLGVIAVQAGVGAHLLDRDPQEARRSLENISTTSRASLAEIRRLLGVVRAPDGSAGFAPPPGLDDLSSLVGDLTDLGLAVDLTVEGDLDGLPSGVGLAAYRIVQEALTNIVRHAGARTVTVRVERDPGSLRVVVTDDGTGAPTGTPVPSGGHGLVGMRERAACFGAELEAGPLAEGGWRVSTRLRVDGAVVA